MGPIDHRALAQALLAPVLAAGAIELKYFRSGIAVERKADRSPVTAADREAEAVIVAALARFAPALPIIAEEAVSAGHLPPDSEAFFLVDPLDGTRDFVAGTEDFTVNVGLISSGRPVFGIILVPARGEVFVTLGAASAAMALVEVVAAASALSDLEWMPISARSPSADGLVATVSPWRHREDAERWLASSRVREWRFVGSSRKFCLVASAEADVYAQPGATHEWDTAAGQAILEAAGGEVLCLDGQPLRYGKRDKGYLNPPYLAWGSRRDR